MRAGRVVAVGLALLLLAVILTLGAVGGGPAPVPGSALSVEDDGRRAAYLVLEELGFATEVWRAAPGRLPPGRSVLWMPRAPESLSEEHADDPLRAARERGLLGRGRYVEFLEQGGSLVLAASEEALDFLESELDLEPDVLPAWELDGAPSLAQGELLELEQGGLTRFLGDGDELLAVRMRVGEGAAVLVADGRWLDNARLGDGDAGLALARLTERLAGRAALGGRILFDEHVLGGGVSSGPVDLALAPDARLLSLHLILLALVAVWIGAWAREFPRDPPPLGQLSPLARARAQAGLLVRAGQAALLADFLRAGTLRRLGARVHGSRPPEGEELTAVVHRLAVERGCPERAGDWTAALADRTVTDLAGLVRLDRELRRVETEVGVHAEFPPRSG